MTETTWSGCYDGSWRGIIVPEAYRHPAKFARGLIQRIYRHMLQMGYVRPGVTVIDPFGGVGLGAVDAMENGLRWVGVELEPHFHKLGNENLALWAKRWGLTGGALLQGDSRRLASVLAEAGACVSSPPFNDSLQNSKERSGLTYGNARYGHKDRVTDATPHDYGTTPGQLGSISIGRHRSGAVESAIRESNVTGDSAFQSHKDAKGMPASEAKAGYGGLETSPPFMENNVNIGAVGDTPAMRQQIHDSAKRPESYGATEGQLGNEELETFWSAARLIVLQCHAILPPGAYAAFVTKDFVRDKQRAPFSDQWRRLCESCGFATVEWIKASLVKERVEATLFEGHQTKKTERKSFFRRLAEKKGSPRIDHEDVLILRREV